ncbi:regulatory signaling modulator protein AmpE [Pseudomonas aeruginosa]|uniref:regulatory signaling modulator protein AmpE n=1 Tax=Pseudomonas aeruginosa TaxID=287 RepID=UPI003F52015D
MQNDANVVHLTRVASEPSPNAGAGRLPVILVQVRDKAALQLKQALQALFDNADDTLFEMADRATSNLEQNAFFEAMRDLRLKRKSIERVYLQKVFEEFSALNQVQSGKSVPTLDTVSFDSLSLVQNEELEESVAVDAMVARVMSRDATALAHLSTRLNTLVGRKVDEKSNPLAPRPLTAAFLDACQGLGVEIKVKLIILKLFEKYVLAHCDQLYAEANQILVAAGVLPELKSALPRRQPAVRPEAVRDAGTLQAQAALLDGGQQEVFGALQELLAQVRDNPSFYRRETPENAAPISSNDLMRLLSHLQQHLPGPGAAEFDVRDGVDQLLQRVSHKSGRSRVVGQVDDDVINLVSMLFEFILDDRTLPDSLKALIGRMQIPMLKVALLDKTFFSRGSHPARRLLNEIASASLGWAEHNDARRDSLYQKIEQVVMRLLNDFVDDPAIFAELLEDFIAFTGDERRRSELLEQRTRDAEEGRAKAELARQDVEQVLNQRLLGKVLPEVVVRLLRDAWSKVMLLICLKHGKASAEWREALDTMDELIWSVGPHDDPLSRQQLLERVPGLLKALREGLASAAFDPFSTGEFFSQLETLHVQGLQRDKRGEAAVADSPLLDEASPGTAAEKPRAPVMLRVVEEIVLTSPDAAPAPVESEVRLPDNDEALLRVDALRVGSWVEIQEDAEHKLRCKLAAVIRPTGRYIFVNRTGMKVLEKTRMGLVEDLPSVSRRSWLGLLLAVVLPLLPLALLLTLLQPLAYGWLSLPLHLLVVVYSLGRGDVMADLGPFRDAWRREEAQAAFHVAERDLGILGGSESELIGRVHGHLLWQGYQSFFAVIFWYALLGPVAALAYRLLALALEHARQPALREQAARVRHILDWLPVRALVLSFALVGNFLAVIRVLLHWLLAWDISAAALLGKAGRVASDVEAVELGAAGVASLDALWQLLVRAAVLWYAVFAFCALFL